MNNILVILTQQLTSQGILSFILDISVVLSKKKTLKVFHFIWNILKMSVLRFLKECLKHNTKAKSDFNCSLYFHFHHIFTSKG